MKLKDNQSKIVGMFFSVLLIIFVFILPINREILLVVNCIFLVITLLKSKISIISLWAIVTNYVILNVYFYDVTGLGYGVLALSKIDFVSMLRYMMILNMSFFFWSTSSNFIKREKNILQNTQYNPGEKFSLVCCAIAIITVLIAFPSLPFSFGNRFEALLPGNAWNHFSIVALIFMIPNIKRYKFVAGTYAFVFFWFLSHYERVDVLGLVVALLLIYAMKKTRKKEEIARILKLGIAFFILFVLMSFLGEARMDSTFSISGILLKLVTQNTASDIGYMYSIAVDYVSKHSLLHGESYLRYLVNLIPIFDTSKLEITTILSQYYGIPGGAFILNEPLMNFGLWGVIIVPNLFIALVYSLIKKITVYRYIVYVFIIATAFRYLWYGVSFIETAIVLLIPFMYLIYAIMKRRKY